MAGQSVHTAWIRALTDPTSLNPLIIARITWVEVLSALARRQREGTITSGDVARAIQTFGYDLDMQYQVLDFCRTSVTLPLIDPPMKSAGAASSGISAACSAGVELLQIVRPDLTE